MSACVFGTLFAMLMSVCECLQVKNSRLSSELWNPIDSLCKACLEAFLLFLSTTYDLFGLLCQYVYLAFLQVL